MGRLLDIPGDVVREYTGFHERRGHAEGSVEYWRAMVGYGLVWYYVVLVGLFDRPPSLGLGHVPLQVD